MTAAPPQATVRVAVQSSRRLLRDALAACLATQPDLIVVGKIAEPGELKSLCELGRPNVIVIYRAEALTVGDALGLVPGRPSTPAERAPARALGG